MVSSTKSLTNLFFPKKNNVFCIATIQHTEEKSLHGLVMYSLSLLFSVVFEYI